MWTFFKAGCIGIYVLALLGLFVALPWGMGPWLLTLTLALIAVHALEAAFVYKYLQTYPGPLAQSLLFGLLHWWPLVQASKKARAA